MTRTFSPPERDRDESEFDRPLGVTSLVGLLAVFVLGWVVGFLGVVANPEHALPLGTTTGLFVGTVVLVTAVVGVLAFGLWFMQRWAWYLGLVVFGLVGVGTVVAGEFVGLLAFVIVVYLLAVRGAFHHPRQMIGG